MRKPDYVISTPENVDLHLQLAGIPNRILAGAIDSGIIFGIVLAMCAVCYLIVVAIVAVEGNEEARTTIFFWLIFTFIICLFLVNFGYYMLYELIWSGQTPGKRLVGIRVIDDNGQPVSPGAIIMRNLIRVADQGLFLIGILGMLTDKLERRYGDLAAGTLVIREGPSSLPGHETVTVTASAPTEAFVDIGQLTVDEYQTLLTFLKRRPLLQETERKRLAADLCKYLREKLNAAPDSEAPEQFLERIYLAYTEQSRL